MLNFDSQPFLCSVSIQNSLYFSTRSVLFCHEDSEGILEIFLRIINVVTLTAILKTIKIQVVFLPQIMTEETLSRILHSQVSFVNLLP